MKYILSLIIGGALVVSGFGQTRNVLVGTNNAVVQPTNFWSADAANARTGLGLGTAATNPATAFQPSSLVLSNLASSNAGSLTNLNAANIVGILSVAQGGTGATNASSARTALGLGTASTNSESAFQPSSATLSNLATANGGSLTNLQSSSLVGVIPSSNIPSVTFTGITGTLSLAQGGTGATNASNARQNLGSTTVGDAVFIATNAAAARTALSLGTAATSATTDFQPADSDLTNLAANNAINLTNFPALLLRTNGNGAGLTNLTAANITGTVALASNVGGVVAITNGGTGATNAATARTNLGIGWITSGITNIQTFKNLMDLGTNSVARFGYVVSPIIESEKYIFLNDTDFDFQGNSLDTLKALLGFDTNSILTIRGLALTELPIYFDGTNNAAQTRTNLGLGLPVLTNTNNANFLAALFGSNTNPALVNTNGEVVSPTNFWQVAPISTTVQNQTNVTATSTNAATNSRNLFLFSLAPSVSGVTNTVTLPTNPATTFEGDRATITHLAQTTNAVTAIRQLGAATNLITLNQLDETVLLMYRGGAWRLADNISYIEPIYFSGTNAAANAATSRTNLGLGATWLTNTNVTNFRTGIGLGETNSPTFDGINVGTDVDITPYGMIGYGAEIDLEERDLTVGSGNEWNLGNSGMNSVGAISFANTTNAATTRTNLGLPLPALTNTNNANFRNAIELGATNNVSFSNVTASGTLTATGTVTATTNLVVNGFVDFSTNHTNSNPATNNQINDFIEIRVGTNQFWLPVYK